MMKVVAPLRIESVAACLRRSDHAHVVQIAFGNRPRRAPKRVRLLVKTLGDLCEQVARADVYDAMDGVEPKRVHVILSQPVERVVNEITTHAVRVLLVEVEGIAPRRAVVVIEDGRVVAKIVAFGAEVVIDHIQDDGETRSVARINETL